MMFFTDAKKDRILSSKRYNAKCVFINGKLVLNGGKRSLRI